MEENESATARQGGSWEEVARARRERLAAAIPPEWVLSSDLLARLNTCTDVRPAPAEAGFLSPRELALTDIEDAARLCRMLAERECSAVELVMAFCKRAAIAHQLLNCCLDLFFDEALKRARVLDDELERTGRPVGVLHGLPISLKDQFNVVGHDTTLGYVGRDSQPADHNSTLVEGLLAQGAVLYVKTSLPQSIMKPETVNHLICRTTHPADRRLSPGGSSGGEGALLAFHGSPLGVGTDIGGSIRIPSALCGLYGLRPTHGRVPYFRAENTMVRFPGGCIGATAMELTTRHDTTRHNVTRHTAHTTHIGWPRIGAFGLWADGPVAGVDRAVHAG
jgi:amidase